MFLSLRSRNFGDRFIRHQNFLGELTPIVSDLDRRDATFFVQELAGGKMRLVATNLDRTFVLRHQDFRLKLSEFNPPLLPPGGQFPPDLQLLIADSQFIMQPGLAGGGVSFRSFNFSDRFIRHRDFHLFVEVANSELARNDATFDQVPPFAEPPAPPNIVH
jgi:Alpha-L-arabinofuranosidase B (ABFB) domain